MSKKLIVLTGFVIFGQAQAAQTAAPASASGMEAILRGPTTYLQQLRASTSPGKQLSTLLSSVEARINANAANPAVVKTTSDYIRALNLLIDNVGKLNDQQLSNAVKNAAEQSLQKFAQTYKSNVTLQSVFNNTNLKDFMLDFVNWVKENLGVKGASSGIVDLQGKLAEFGKQLQQKQPSQLTSAQQKALSDQQKAQSDRAIKALMPKKVQSTQQKAQGQPLQGAMTQDDVMAKIHRLAAERDQQQFQQFDDITAQTGQASQTSADTTKLKPEAPLQGSGTFEEPVGGESSEKYDPSKDFSFGEGFEGR